MTKIKIGSGIQGNSAYTIQGLPPGVPYMSQNHTSFWISNGYLGMDLVVFRDTEQGHELERLIDAGAGTPIAAYIRKLVLEHASSSAIQQAIQREINAAYEMGKDAKAQDIRRALGL